MRDEQLLAYLKGSCSGRKNRIGGTELERTLHVSGTDLRKLVNQLRRKTHPIASDRNGYFYATTAGEVYDTAETDGGRTGSGHQRSGTVYGSVP